MFMNANTKMKLIVAISILTLIRAEDNQSVYIIDGVPHYNEILFENIHQDFNSLGNNLVVDYKTNNLYVNSYDHSEVLDINTKEHKLISDLSHPQCVTVDQVNHDVYIGTTNGIYIYNDTTGEVELVGARGNIVRMIYHYNGVLYYSTYFMSNQMRTLDNGQSVRYYEFDFGVKNFVVGSEENIFYQTYNGSLFRYKDATKHTFLYEGIPDVRSLTTDRFGNVYFSVDDGIYKIEGDSVESVVNINNTRYIAFDGDNNLIYYNDKEYKLYRLKPTNITNSSSDSYSSHIQELEDTNNNDIKTELQIMNKKIDNLLQVLNMLLTNIMEKQLVHSHSPRSIHLDSIVLKNINISIGLNESGVAQIPT